MTPSVVKSTNHELSSPVPEVFCAFTKLNVIALLILVEVITYQVPVRLSYPKPKFLYNSIFSRIVVSIVVGKSVIKLGITSVGTALVGIKLLSVTGPVPSALFPVPKFVPSSSNAVTVAHNTVLSPGNVGDPTASLFVAVKYCPTGGVNFTKPPRAIYFLLSLACGPTGAGALVATNLKNPVVSLLLVVL